MATGREEARVSADRRSTRHRHADTMTTVAQTPVYVPPGGLREIIVAFDSSSTRTWVAVGRLIEAAPQGIIASAPALDPSPGDLLDDHLLAPLADADGAVLLGSFENPLLTGFQAGVIEAMLGRPILIAGLSEEDRQIVEMCTDMTARSLDEPSALWPAIVSALPETRYPRRMPRRTDVEQVLYPKRTRGDDDVASRVRANIPSVSAGVTGRRVPPSLTWVIRDLALDLPGHKWDALETNLRNAVYAGWYYGCDWRLAEPARASTPLRVLREVNTPPVRELSRFEQVFDGDQMLLSLLGTGDPATSAQLVIEELTLVNFKGFERLSLSFAGESSLPGNWTCIAGINGSGKTSVLQALCLVLLGRRSASELGAERLARMIRPTARGGTGVRAEIRAVVRDGATLHDLVLPLDERGIDEKALYSSRGGGSAEHVWARLENELLVAYGATRNVSEYLDTRNANLSPRVRRQMTLFDPLTQVAGVEALLSGGPTWQAALRTLCKILDVVLDANELGVQAALVDGRLRFVSARSELNVVDLPDGFRSLVAWLGDLCVAWHESTGTDAEVAPSEIRGTVLLDEIDLHLHASLQRTIVPALRRALPNVQWIVSTHSPLILSSFDRHELVLLDRKAPDGVRRLDRQILGFTTDEIYEWLMGTPPSSAVLDEKLAEAPEDEALAVLLLQSKDKDEDAARRQLDRTRELVARLTPEPPRER